MSRLAAHALSLARLSAYCTATIALLPVQLAALALGRRPATEFPVLYHGWMLALLGFRVTIHGTRSAEPSTLYVSNHGSYIDIEILGATLPASFIAKDEVKGWPLFGLLARLQRTVFVDRRARSTAGQRDSLTRRLETGDSLILFPEGTSSDGNRLLPFKSALFAAAELRVGGRPITVQPVTVAYTRLNGMPIGRELRPYFAWYGNMTLAGHLWTMVGQGLVDVVVQLHPPVTIELLGSRKKLAEHCARVIGEGLSAANAGRLRPPPEAVPAPARLPAGGTPVAAS